MKRILLLILAISLIMLPLAACDDSGGGNGGGGGNGSPAPVTLTVWESIDGPDEFIKQAGAIFTERNPHITINYVNVELGDTVSRITLDGPAGIGADVFVAPHDRLGGLVTAESVQPVKNASAVRNNVLGATAMAATFDGVMYGYPVAAETYALFYNKDLIATPPTTWEGVVDFARGFNAPSRWGFYMNVTSAYYGILFTTSEHNLLFGESGTDTTATNINSPASVKGIQFFQSMREILDVAANDIDDGFGEAGFSAGQIAMFVTGPWNIKNFADAGLNFGVAPLPSLPGESTPASSFSGTRCMFVSNFTQYPDEAHAFAEFLTTPEMAQLRYNITEAIPAVNIPVDSPYLPGLIEQLDYAFPMPSIPQMDLYWDTMSAALSNIWNGADVQTELDAADRTIIGS